MTTRCGRALLMAGLGLLIVFCVTISPAEQPKPKEASAKSAAAATRSRPKITISKETTYVTEPLRADGRVDYVAAINRRLSEGVTPENNAAVLFLQALGPKKIDRSIRKLFFERLGIAELHEEGEYFILPEDFLQQKMGWKVCGGDTDEDRAKVQKMWDQVWRECHVPWSSEDDPFLAALLHKNEKALQFITEGSKRSRFYLPAISAEGPAEARRFTFDSIRDLRFAAQQLAARATWRMRNQEIDLAWHDVMAGFRLARLTGQGPLITDSLLALSCEGQVLPAAIALAQHGGINVQAARRWQSDLCNLPRSHPLGASLNYGARLESLTTVLDAAEHGYHRANVLAQVGLPPDPTFKAMFGLDDVHQKAYQLYSSDPRIDWDEALRYVNAWHDRLVAACGQSSYRRRHDALAQLAAEAKQRAGQALEHASLPRNPPSGEDFFTALLKAAKTDGRSSKVDDLRRIYDIASQRDATARKGSEQAVRRASLPRDLTPKQIAEHFVDLVLGPEWEGADLALKPYTEEQARMNLLCLALALAAYHHDYGHYPKTLSELAPKYIAQIPNDPYSDEPMRYGRRIGGYLLYSVGPNGKDDGGRNFQEELETNWRGADSSWDDIGIRMPPRSYHK